MPKKKRDIAIGVGIAAGLGGLAYYLFKRGGVWVEPPDDEIPDGEPPGEGYGRIQGYIKDAVTGASITDSKIYLNGKTYSISGGVYRTEYILFGIHELSVIADNYETGKFTVDLKEELINLDLLLQPLPMEPGPWSQNVTVESMSVRPAVAYLGEEVLIECYILYRYPAPLPTTITGTVRINGDEVSRDFDLDFRNPTVSFPYTPVRIGEFTARAQDKSASFKVVAQTVGAIYSPWGGIRMPYPVRWHATDGKVYEFNYQGEGLKHGYSSSPPAAFLNGYGEWKPVGSNVTSWMFKTNWSWTSYVTRIVPTRWTGCPSYWNSKEELAKVLVRDSIRIYKDEGQEHPYAVYDIRRGLAFWGSEFDWSTAGSAGFRLLFKCPHCGHIEYGPTLYQGHDRSPLMRAMIEHIETKHPQYLSQPSHGEFKILTCKKCGGTGVITGRRKCSECDGAGQRWYRIHVWGLYEF